MKKLVISEKNSVALRISIILSGGKFRRENRNGLSVFRFTSGDEEYAIVGLRGHIVELDFPEHYNQWNKVDPKELIYVEPVKRILYKRIVEALKEEAGNADWIIVATDFDREGELIGVEALELVSSTPEGNGASAEGLLPGVKIRRARFSSLGRNDVVTSFQNLFDVDTRLAASAECRQVIDLAWGATLTRMISMAAGQRGKNFLSVGRVQSPTLSLIARREMEITAFEPKNFYLIEGRGEKGYSFRIMHASNPFWNRKDAENVFAKISGSRKGTVSSYSSAVKEEYPPSPFSTTLFLVDATRLGYSGAEAMDIAEKLYASGFISYPRTDNTVYPRSLNIRGTLEKLKQGQFEADAIALLSQQRIVPSRGATETTDHPPIYPVEYVSSKKLGSRAWPIYELIVRRFFATVAPRSRYIERKAQLDVERENFLANGRELLEAGWRAYYPYYRFNESRMPELIQGEEIAVSDFVLNEDQTKPPARYTQGALIKEMEKLGLGTKSTRHEIIQKLYERKYVEGQTIRPTPVGMSVSLSLEKRAPEICDSGMTAQLERDMDAIAEGSKEMSEVLEESRRMLTAVALEVEKNSEEIGRMIREAIDSQKRLGRCPSCGGELRIIESGGKKYAGCTNYPECRVNFTLPSGFLIQPTEKVCEVCSMPVVRLITRGQKPMEACIDPACRSNSKHGAVGKCPACGREMRIIRSQRGKRFMGCEGYPSCTVSYPLPQYGEITPTGKQCPMCGAPLVIISVRGRGRWTICPNTSCQWKSGAGEAKMGVVTSG